MNYKQMNIETLSTGQEVVSNLLIAAGVGGFEVIDPQDFKEFIETVTPHWDYVDEELLKRQSDRTVIKVYAADNEQGAAMFKDIEQRIEALRTDPQAALYGTLEITVCDLPEEDWQSGWKQYYKPISVERLTVVPMWEDYTAKEGEFALPFCYGGREGAFVVCGPSQQLPGHHLESASSRGERQAGMFCLRPEREPERERLLPSFPSGFSNKREKK